MRQVQGTGCFCLSGAAGALSLARLPREAPCGLGRCPGAACPAPVGWSFCHPQVTSAGPAGMWESPALSGAAGFFACCFPGCFSPRNVWRAPFPVPLGLCHMLPVPVPAAALGSRAEEAVTALVRHEGEGGRPLCITHYLLGLILDDLDQLPGGKELFQGWDQCSAPGEGAEHPRAGCRARNPPLSCLAQRVRLNRQGWILGQSLGSGSLEVPRR